VALFGGDRQNSACFLGREWLHFFAVNGGGVDQRADVAGDLPAPHRDLEGA
jgi:hypothetical protein